MPSLSAQRMQLSDDPDDWCWVRWQWCQPGAEVMPDFHATGFGLWETDRSREPDGMHVNMRPSEYRPSQVSPHPGAGLLGKIEWFQAGLPEAARGGTDWGRGCDGEVWGGEVYLGADASDAAHENVLSAEGGQAEGGEAEQRLSTTMQAAGGEAEGGAARQGGGARLRAAGGQAEGGQAAQGHGVAVSAQGGEAQGGIAFQIPGVGIVAEGGEAEGGEAVQGGGVILSPDGGEAEGGEAGQSGAGGAEMPLGTKYVPAAESTTSTSFVDLATVDFVNFTVASSTDILITYDCQALLGTGLTGEGVESVVTVDGTQQSGTAEVTSLGIATGASLEHGCRFETTVAAGSHTVSVMHRSQTGDLVTLSNRSLVVWQRS